VEDLFSPFQIQPRNRVSFDELSTLINPDDSNPAAGLKINNKQGLKEMKNQI
jgi:hypothetical protein